jgi:diaminopimelate decarboxylase
LTTFEMLRYLWRGHLPRSLRPAPRDLFARYGAALVEAIARGCRRHGLAPPDLIVEPGRALASDAEVLLLTVGAIRERPGIGRYALTDGGAMTVSLMFLSELHAVLLASRAAPDDRVPTSVFGRLPSPMDVVYRKLRMPALRSGDLLAVMDAGAYFTSTATNFGGPRPAVLLIDGGEARLVRRRETSDDLTRVDLVLPPGAGTVA